MNPCGTFPAKRSLEDPEANLGREHLRATEGSSCGVPHSSPLTSLLDVSHNLGCEAPIVEGLGALLGQYLQCIGQLWHSHSLSFPKHLPLPAEHLAGAEKTHVTQQVWKTNYTSHPSLTLLSSGCKGQTQIEPVHRWVLLRPQCSLGPLNQALTVSPHTVRRVEQWLNPTEQQAPGSRVQLPPPAPSQDEPLGHAATYHKAGVFSIVSRFLSRADAKPLPTGKPWRASSMLGWKRRAQGSRPCRWCASS